MAYNSHEVKSSSRHDDTNLTIIIWILYVSHIINATSDDNITVTIVVAP